MAEIALERRNDLMTGRSHDLGAGCCSGGVMALAAASTTGADYSDFVSADPSAFVETDQDGNLMLHMLVENMHCANCIKTIEQTLKSNDAVLDARVNFSTRRLFAAG